MYTKGGGRSLGWNLLLIKNDIDNKLNLKLNLGEISNYYNKTQTDDCF